MKKDNWKLDKIFEILRYKLQEFHLLKQDDDFYNKRQKRLHNNILKDTNWLAGSTYSGGRTHSLPFHQQAIKLSLAFIQS